MFSMIKRQLLLYFHNKANVFFSLMGAWVAFLLYIIFLQDGMLEGWSAISHSDLLLDYWVMGGTLAVTSVTTTWMAATRLVKDKESHKLEDFLLTDSSLFRLNLAYLFSASLIGFIMQAMMFAIMSCYFAWQDHLPLAASQFPQLIVIMLLSSMLGASLALIIAQAVHTLEVAERISVIIGTASGFLVGVYMPVGALPDLAQKLIKVTPAAYVSAAYRQVLMAESLSKWAQNSQTIKAYLGIGLEVNRHLISYTQNLAIVSLLIFLAFVVLGFIQLVKKRGLG